MSGLVDDDDSDVDEVDDVDTAAAAACVCGTATGAAGLPVMSARTESMARNTGGGRGGDGSVVVSPSGCAATSTVAGSRSQKREMSAMVSMARVTAQHSSELPRAAVTIAFSYCELVTSMIAISAMRSSSMLTIR